MFFIHSEFKKLMPRRFVCKYVKNCITSKRELTSFSSKDRGERMGENNEDGGLMIVFRRLLILVIKLGLQGARKRPGGACIGKRYTCCIGISIASV